MDDLLNSLQAYRASSEKEEQDRLKILYLIENRKDRCFYRDCFDPGHITASALVVNERGDRVLMNHHKGLGKWLCFGGHADGETDMLAVALREAQEESGITSLMPVFTTIFDLDVHTIPENPKRGEPAHDHHDIVYIFRCTGPSSFVMSEESLELRWCTYPEALRLTGGNNMHRLLDKWQDSR